MKRFTWNTHAAVTVDRIVERVGSQAALASLCHVSPQAVSKWRDAGIPPEHCRVIEAATGIPAEEQRPDIFGRVVVQSQSAAA